MSFDLERVKVNAVTIRSKVVLFRSGPLSVIVVGYVPLGTSPPTVIVIVTSQEAPGVEGGVQDEGENEVAIVSKSPGVPEPKKDTADGVPEIVVTRTV